jgi:hypothetical protein
VLDIHTHTHSIHLASEDSVLPNGSTLRECKKLPSGSTLRECKKLPSGSTLRECKKLPSGSTLRECKNFFFVSVEVLVPKVPKYMTIVTFSKHFVSHLHIVTLGFFCCPDTH